MSEKRVQLKRSVPKRLILVDSESRELGTSEKFQIHREGQLHRAFSIFVFDVRSRLLLQKRASSKYPSERLWSNTVCGHPRPGEARLAAAHRRLREEMGFDCELRPAFGFLYRAELDGVLVEHEYHVLVGTHTGNPTPNPLEVDDWRWIDMEELRSDLLRVPFLYSFWLKIAIEGDRWTTLESLINTDR